MELWEVMNWGDEPLPMHTDTVLFAGIKKSELENQPFRYFDVKYLNVKVIDEVGNVSEKKCPDPKYWQASYSKFVSKILDNSTVEVYYLKDANGMFSDLVMREPHHISIHHTVYELKFQSDEFGKIPWDELDLIDKKRAVQCLTLAGYLEDIIIKNVIKVYFPVRGDWCGTLPPHLPRKKYKILDY